MNALCSLSVECLALDRAIAQLQKTLTELATQDDLQLRAQQVFGGSVCADRLERFCQQWARRNWQSLPAITTRPCEEINGANALFSQSDRCIYIAQEYLSWQRDRPDAIAAVLLEAIGHFLGTEIGCSTASWNGGAIFAESLRETARHFKHQFNPARSRPYTFSLFERNSPSLFQGGAALFGPAPQGWRA